jgi:hypothetical protein
MDIRTCHSFIEALKGLRFGSANASPIVDLKAGDLWESLKDLPAGNYLWEDGKWILTDRDAGFFGGNVANEPEYIISLTANGLYSGPIGTGIHSAYISAHNRGFVIHFDDVPSDYQYNDGVPPSHRWLIKHRNCYTQSHYFDSGRWETEPKILK